MKKLVIYYFIFLFFLLSFFSSGVIDSQDGLQYLAVARNIYYKHELTAPVYEYDRRENIHMSTYLGKDGKTYSPTGIGFSLAMVPAVAITDIVYKVYGIPLSAHFPLENDWLILLTASFTNIFFGAILGVILFLYLIELGLSKKQALFISLVGIFSTNLLVYTKHLFAHMMFSSFLITSFFLVKKYFQTRKKLYLFLSGVSFGITAIAYNVTFILAILPLGLYLVILSRVKLNVSSIISKMPKILIMLIGFFPFLLFYIWLQNLEAAMTQNLANPSEFAARIASPFNNFPVSVFFEGLFGQLFSPGRSIFLYSPILLVVILFWHRIKKSAEFWVFLLLALIYILYISTLYSRGIGDQGITGLWHGELSWGPRYLISLVPLGLLTVGSIYTQLKKKEKIFLFFPLLVLGFYVQLLGLIMPYQVKLHDLETRVYINSTEFSSSTYSNFLPRYSPVILMSKKLVRLYQSFPKSFDHGIYNVKYYDGIDFPFNVGPERWRVIEGNGYISFDDNIKNPITELAFGLINHPLKEASHSATIQFVLNDIPLLEKSVELKPTDRKVIRISLKKDILKPTGNNLIIQSSFDVQTEIKFDLNPNVIIGRTQILGLQSFDINGQRQNMESIDVPYVSLLGPKMGATYQNWGGTNKDPWKTWDIHTQMFERLPDFWWIRNLYYWDIPKGWILSLFIFNLIMVIITYINVRKYLTK